MVSVWVQDLCLIWEVCHFLCFSYDFQMTLASDKDTDSISVTSIGSSSQRLLQDLIVIDVYGVQPAGITWLIELNSTYLLIHPNFRIKEEKIAQLVFYPPSFPTLGRKPMLKKKGEYNTRKYCCLIWYLLLFGLCCLWNRTVRFDCIEVITNQWVFITFKGPLQELNYNWTWWTCSRGS